MPSIHSECILPTMTVAMPSTTASSRADLFPEDALDASIQLAFSSGTTDTTYRDALSKWDFDAVLLSKESNAPAIEFMEVLPGWEKTIENDYYVIFTPQ